MIERIDTVVVGGGQAGLAMSHHLTRMAREHVVIERFLGLRRTHSLSSALLAGVGTDAAFLAEHIAAR